MLFNHNLIVKTENVEVGFVCQYNNVYHYLRKIIYARSTQDLLISNKQWAVTKIQNLETGEFENEEILEEMNYGIDLCETVGSEKIKYLVDTGNVNKNEGDIIIIYPIKVGNFLRFLGFPEYLTSKELKYAKKLLLDSSYPIKSIKYSKSLDELEKIDLLEVKKTIEKLKRLKIDGNPFDVTKIERQIFKNNLALKKEYREI